MVGTNVKSEKHNNAIEPLTRDEMKIRIINGVGVESIRDRLREVGVTDLEELNLPCWDHYELSLLLFAKCPTDDWFRFESWSINPKHSVAWETYPIWTLYVLACEGEKHPDITNKVDPILIKSRIGDPESEEHEKVKLELYCLAYEKNFRHPDFQEPPWERIELNNLFKEDGYLEPGVRSGALKWMKALYPNNTFIQNLTSEDVERDHGSFFGPFAYRRTISELVNILDGFAPCS